MTRALLALVPLAAATMIPPPVSAQTLGTFRWQMQPYCNVITVTVTQAGAVYRVEGTDDQCGGGRDLASVQGLAFPNPDGTIGFGLTLVTTPGGHPLHVDAAITLATLTGTWHDSVGASGGFVFTPGAPAGGAPRPIPTATVPAAIRLQADGGVLATGSPDVGAIPASGSGLRMMWFPGRAAFRAGRAEQDRWDDANVGAYSVAFGNGTIASGKASAAFGTSARATGDFSTAFGSSTHASGVVSTAMGLSTRASGDYSTAMGNNTEVSGTASLGLGFNSTVSGNYAFAGGRSATAAGDNSFAYGFNAYAGGFGSVALGTGARTSAAAHGAMVLADSSSGPFEASLPNEFGARFTGGFYLYTRKDLSTGAALAANGSSWAALSDVNAKENFRDVSGEEVLRKLAQIPIREWNYRAQDRSIRHMGPTAQDFNAAFGLGDFPLRINTIDADGVALAGVNALEARTRALQDEVETLRRRLDALLATALRER
jgi:hypothetical protein